MADSKHPDEATVGPGLCALCGLPIGGKPNETFTISTEGKAWHYGCAPCHSRPAVPSLGDDEMVEMLTKALDALEVALGPWHGAAKTNGLKFVAESRAAIAAMTG